MPFIQHTDADRAAMLEAIGVKSIDDLYVDIPADIRVKEDGDKVKMNPSMGELEVTRHINALLAKTKNANDFAFFRGAGIYNHHVSTLTDHIALYDGNFITAYEAEMGGIIASVMCGGDVNPGTLISEDYLLQLEREGFLKLCGNKKTAERIQHMLKTGKTLRN